MITCNHPLHPHVFVHNPGQRDIHPNHRCLCGEKENRECASKTDGREEIMPFISRTLKSISHEVDKQL